MPASVPPHHSAKPAAPEKSCSRRAPGQQLRLLLVSGRAGGEIAQQLQHWNQHLRQCPGSALQTASIVDFAPHIVLVEVGGCGSALALSAPIRQQWPEAGLILLTEATRPEHRLQGYRLGADHCLSLPLDPRLLLAHTDALLRRIGLPAAVEGQAWQLDCAGQRLSTPDGVPLALSRSECCILACMQAAPQHLTSRRMLVEALGGDYLNYDERRLEAMISRLRRKLAVASGTPAAIRALRAQGYQFTGDLQRVDG